MSNSKRKFPRLRADGTFSVYVFFDAPGVTPADVETWLISWATQNTEWHFEWNAVTNSDRLYWADTFYQRPHLALSNEGRLGIRLDIAKEPYWKDWYARLVIALQTEFPQISLIKVVNC